MKLKENNLISSIKSIVSNQLNRSYSLSKWRFFQTLKNNLQDRRKAPILIHTNGKVGSSTIHNSLQQSEHPVFHVHYLGKNYLKDYENFVKQNYFNKQNRGAHLYKSLLWTPQYVNKNYIGKEKVKAITIWRDPISKNMSTLFQWIHFREDENHYYFHSHQYDLQFDIKTTKEDLSPLIDFFLENFPHKIHEDWIEEEQGQLKSLPYLNHEFDKEKGFQILENEEWELLTLKIESFSNENYADVIGDFSNVKDFEFDSVNLTSEKQKNVAYLKFKEQIKFPKSLLDEIYNSEFMNHFYTQEEISAFRNRLNTLDE